MRDVKLVNMGIHYGIQELDIVIVPIVYENPNDAIAEWEYFEMLNTNSNRRFFSHALTLKEIEEIANKLKSEI